jgi:hypothetical protein
VDFLDFMLSGKKDIEAFAQSRQKPGCGQKPAGVEQMANSTSGVDLACQ